MSDNINVAATISVNDAASAAVGGISRAFQGMSETAQRVGQNIRNTLSAPMFQKIGQNFSNLGSAFARVGSAIGSIARPVAAALGIAGGVGLAASVTSMQDWAREAAQLPRVAHQLGVTAEQLQILQKAAELAGTPIDTFRTGMSRFNRVIDAAARDPKKFAAIAGFFEHAGINIRNADGSIRRINEILPELAEYMGQIEDPGARAEIVTRLFGRGMEGLLGFLGQGPEKFDEFIKRAKEYGLIMPEQTKVAQDYLRAQKDLGEALDDLGKQIFPMVAPMFTQMAQSITAFLQDEDRSKNFVETLGRLFTSLAGAIKAIPWEWLIQKFEDFVKWAEQGDRPIWLLTGAMTALGLITFGPLIAAVAALGVAFIGLGAPGLAIVAALAGVGAAAYLLWQNWDEVGPKIEAWQQRIMQVPGNADEWSQWWEQVKTDWSNDWTEINSAWDSSVRPLLERWEGALRIGLADAWDSIKEKLGNAWQWIVDKWNATLGPIWSQIAGFFSGSAGAGFGEGAKEGEAEVQSFADKVAQYTTRAKNSVQSLSDGFSQLTQNIDAGRIAANLAGGAVSQAYAAATVAKDVQAFNAMTAEQQQAWQQKNVDVLTTGRGMSGVTGQIVEGVWGPVARGLGSLQEGLQAGWQRLGLPTLDSLTGRAQPAAEVNTQIKVDVTTTPPTVEATTTATGAGVTVEQPNVGVSMIGALA